MELFVKAVIGLIEGLIVVSHLGQVLGLAIFPIYAIVFLVRLKRRQFHRLRHATMILFTLAFVLSGLNFLSFCLQFAKRSKQAEAETYLRAIYITQLGYHDEYSEYARGKDCFNLLGWEPEGDTIYAYYCDQDVILPSNPYAHPVPPLEEILKLGAPRPEVGKDAFRVMAVGNLDIDEYLDVWTMDDAKDLKNVINDVGNVGAGKLPPLVAINAWLTESHYTIHQVVLGLITPILILSLLRDWLMARKKNAAETASEADPKRT